MCDLFRRRSKISRMTTDDVTPVRQQYLEIKRQYPHALLFFRLGDFYETFDQDAETVSRELEIVLTSRPIGKGIRAPLAGIPYHAAESYISRLIDKGYHVAICEQVGEQPAKGIMSRKVVRVVTPGTIIEPGLLHSDKNNYLAAYIVEAEQPTVTPRTDQRLHAGIAYVDISTGEFAATEMETDNNLASVRAELIRLSPAETIQPESLVSPIGFPDHITRRPAWQFEPGKCRDIILSQFRVTTLEGLGLENKPLALRSVGAIIQYLKDTAPTTLGLLTSLRLYSLSEYMLLDAATRRNLEITETLRGDPKNTLLGVLDHTVTPMGKRLLVQWISQPLRSINQIGLRQGGVGYYLSRSMLRAELRSKLKQLGDLERITNRISTNHAQPRDLIALRETLSKLPALALLEGVGDKLTNNPQDNHPIFLCSDELELLQKSVDDDAPQTLQNSGIIRSGYSTELDDVIEASRHAREWINNLESSERLRTGIKTLRVGYNKVFGYYLEVSQGQAGNVPDDYIRKQTLVNAERFITPEMKEYETLVLNAEERIHEIELRLFREICLELTSSADRLLETSHTLAELDVLSALAEAAALGRYICPEIREDNMLDIRGGRHPVVEQSLRDEPFIPNELVFEQGEIVRIITGPNMSGKSTYLRQAALIVLMAQIGSYVPADSATIGVIDRIFTRIGAQDEIHSGQSTFMVEMIETANILHNATAKSLLILDEIGRGTSTYDGVSIAWAVIEYIHNHPQLRAKTLFATHYHELTQLSSLLPGVRNYNVAVSEASGAVIFLHKIVPGGADRSYGIHVAQLAGLPRPVILRAEEILSKLERSSGKAVRLDTLSAQQVALFPESSPILDELRKIDVNEISPIEAINRLFELKSKYTNENG